MIEITTERLRLRQWRATDFPVFASMNAEAEVMEHYPHRLTRQESNQLASRFQELITVQGWGYWAVEQLTDERFMGFVGLHKPNYDFHINPCIEIGWRLAKTYWGQGFATEAAKASLDIAFRQLQIDEIHSFTAVTNRRSESVMKRLGMVNTERNFPHPMVPEGSHLKEHVLYKIDKNQWQEHCRQTNLKSANVFISA